MHYATLIFRSIIGDIHCFFSGEYLIKVSIGNDKNKFDNLMNKFIDKALSSSADRKEGYINSPHLTGENEREGDLRGFSKPGLTKKEINLNKPVLDSDSFDKVFSSMSKELALYFSGQLREFKQPFRLIWGTPFEHDVWLTLLKIPFGETRTYKWLAEKIQSPLSYRAVGQALRRNPLPLILPCHRVIASDGNLYGFSAGIELKKWLLRHETAI